MKEVKWKRNGAGKDWSAYLSNGNMVRVACQGARMEQVFFVFRNNKSSKDTLLILSREAAVQTALKVLKVFRVKPWIAKSRGTIAKRGAVVLTVRQARLLVQIAQLYCVRPGCGLTPMERLLVGAAKRRVENAGNSPRNTRKTRKG